MNIDLKKLIAKYSGKWVALNSEMNKVVASGKKANKVHSEASKKGLQTPFLFNVPTKLTAYIG